jgi:hypothetical protein
MSSATATFETSRKPVALRISRLRPAQTSLLQRKCACGGTPGPSGECEECRKKRLRRKANASQSPAQAGASAPPIVHEVLRSPGRPLNAETRAFMEPCFGHDFRHVRVHTDARSANSARAVNALAYTVGPEIVFGAGLYQPDAPSGQRLLAHELAHTLQQGTTGESSDSSPLRVGDSDNFLEREAEETSNLLLQTNQEEGRASMPVNQGPVPTLLGYRLVQRACDQPESFYVSSPRFCLDAAFSPITHKGKACYREIPPGTGCPPGDHCCFAPDGTVEDSRDKTSPADGKKNDGTCTWNVGCTFEHIFTDFIPGVLDAAAENIGTGAVAPLQG